MKSLEKASCKEIDQLNLTTLFHFEEVGLLVNLLIAANLKA